MYEHLDKRYALALYEVAKEKGNVEKYISDLRKIVDTIKGNEELINIIKHPQVSTLEKKDIFKEIFKEDIEKEVLSFLLILIEKDRILFIEQKLEEMKKIYFDENKKITVEIKTAIKLTALEKEKIINLLEKKYEKEIYIIEKIDNKILGGVYIKVGDDVIDGTIKSKLNEIKKSVSMA